MVARPAFLENAGATRLRDVEAKVVEVGGLDFEQSGRRPGWRGGSGFGCCGPSLPSLAARPQGEAQPMHGMRIAGREAVGHRPELIGAGRVADARDRFDALRVGEHGDLYACAGQLGIAVVSMRCVGRAAVEAKQHGAKEYERDETEEHWAFRAHGDVREAFRKNRQPDFRVNRRRRGVVLDSCGGFALDLRWILVALAVDKASWPARNSRALRRKRRSCELMPFS